MAATGYLLTALLIWAVVVALGMTGEEAKLEPPRGPRNRLKRYGIRPGLRRMRGSKASVLVPAAFLAATAHGDKLESQTA